MRLTGIESTWRHLLWVHHWVDGVVCQPLKNLERDAEKLDGSVRLGVLRKFISLWVVTTVARRQVFGSFDLRKHDVKNEHSTALVFAFW